MNFLDEILGLLVADDIINSRRSTPAHLRILPLGEQDQGDNWKITFSVENLTEQDIAIAPIVTASFKTGAGESNAAFMISGADTTIPAMSKKSFSALARDENIKPAKPYSLNQIHVTPLAMEE